MLGSFERFTAPTPAWVWAGTFGIPYLIAYLVHFPHTRVIRLGLFPVGMLCTAWLVMTIHHTTEPLLAMAILETALKWNLTAAGQYAFWSNPPIYPPLPVEPPLSRIRHSTPFKAFNLILDANRLTTLQPSTRPHVPYFRSLLRHFGASAFHSLMVDLNTFPLYYLDIGPTHPVVGLQTWLGSVHWPMMIGFNMYQGTAMILEATAGIFVLLGLYTGEEWIKFFHNPFISTSLNEVWGKRYHSLMRNTYIRLARPFEWLPRPIYILAIFFISALYHLILYHPFTGHFEWTPHLVFWLGSGVGCILERAYGRVTGRKVSGWGGRIWGIGWFCLISRPLVKFELEHGWPVRGKMLVLQGTGKEQLLNWILYGLGLPGPITWNKV